MPTATRAPAGIEFDTAWAKLRRPGDERHRSQSADNAYTALHGLDEVTAP
ncbi:hypothetical protein [Streptomyces sp. NPDC053367]